MAFELTNTDNVTDSDALELMDATDVSTMVVDGTTYLFVAAGFNNAVSVFSVDADGTLTNADSVIDAGDLQLGDAVSTASAEIGGIPYLFVAGNDDDGVSVFAVGEDGTLVNVDNVNDADAGAFNLDGVKSVATLTFGAATYLFVAGQTDSGVSVFSVGADGTLTNVDNVADGGSLELLSAYSVTTAVVNGFAYLFVTGITDDGVSVFRISPDGSLTNVDNVTDGGALELDGAAAATTAKVGGTTYLFVAGLFDDGVSVFSVSPSGALTNVDNVTDGGALELDGASQLTTAVVDGITYLFVTGSFDNGISVFSVADNGMLTNVINLPDGGDLELLGANAATTSTIGGVPYLFVAGNNDSGVSVFSLDHNIIDEVAAATQIAENTAIGTTVTTVAKVDAADPVVFSIGGADAAFFSVDATTGQVSLDAEPDFEAPSDADGDNVYEIEITADDGIISETKTISVKVSDVNERFEITSEGGGNSAQVSVAENGTVVTTIETDDPEEATTYHIIGGDDASFFDIDTVAGDLTFKAAPDFEARSDADQDNVYEVTIEARDGAHIDRQALSVEVTDISDTPPEITSNGGGPTAAVLLTENDTVVTTVEADDPEETPTYAIIGGADAALFDIDAVTGEVTFMAAPDFDAPTDADGDNIYEVEVEASDGLFSDTQAITVEVTNIDGLIINGASADETLTGAGEEDTLSGRKGEDRLEGLGGNDLLNGGKHRDKLFGGDGEDGFLFTSKLKNKFADRIKDFEVGVDTIHLDRDIFHEVGGAGRLKSKSFDFSKTADSRQDRILYEEDKGWLRYDADGKGGDDAVKFAKVGRNLELSHHDFEVV